MVTFTTWHCSCRPICRTLDQFTIGEGRFSGRALRKTMIRYGMSLFRNAKKLNFTVVFGTCLLVIYFEINRPPCVVVAPYHSEYKKYEVDSNSSEHPEHADRPFLGHRGKFNWTEADVGTRDHNGRGSPEYTLTPVNSPGVQIIPDLCLELEDDCEPPCPCRKRFVVYNAKSNEDDTLPVRIAPQWVTKVNEVINIEYRTEKIPPTHRINNKVPTFFVAHSMDGNLHHYFNDCFIGLYGIMKATGRLKAEGGNQLLYRENERGCQIKKRAHDITRFESFTIALSVQRKNDWYQNLPVHTCFSTAIFGYYPEFDSPEEPYDFIKQEILDRNRKSCPETRVTIIQRTRRKILNIDDVVAATVQAGFPNTDVHIFEYLSLEEQLAVISCTNVLIGVQGAGLEWFNFAKTNRAMIEFTWHNWPPYYTPLVGDRAREVENEHSVINWESYEQAEKPKKPPLTDEVKQKMLRRNVSKKPHVRNVWKWADVVVNISKFKIALQSLKHYVS